MKISANKNLTKDGVTEDSNNAKVFTVDGIDIKDLDISFGKLPSVVYGDVNSDGKVNSIDLAKFRGYLLGFDKGNIGSMES